VRSACVQAARAARAAVVRKPLHTHTSGHMQDHDADAFAPSNLQDRSHGLQAERSSTSPLKSASPHMATALWLAQGLLLPRCTRRVAEGGVMAHELAGQVRAGKEGASRVVHTMAELKFALSVLGVGTGLLMLARHAESPVPLAHGRGRRARRESSTGEQ
jgi:hypothetical protein